MLRLVEANAHPGSAWIRRLAGLPHTFATRPCDLAGLEAEFTDLERQRAIDRELEALKGEV